MNHRPITFPHWKEFLAGSGLSLEIQSVYTREIICFLKHCRNCRSPATVELAKQYLTAREKETSAPAREALRWFYREATDEGSKPRNGVNQDHREEPPPFSSEASPIPEPATEGAVVGQRQWLRPMEPKPAASDLGKIEWEKTLIKTMRLRGLLWRTEETYRKWAVRFAAFITPKTPYAAGDAEGERQC